MNGGKGLQDLIRKFGAHTVWGVALAVILGFILYQSMYTVSEWEQAVITQFGEVKGEPVIDAGLHFKLPFIQRVHSFDRRLLRWDGRETTTITQDRKTILIDVTARWRIDNARMFLEAIGSKGVAGTRLDGIIEGAVKDEIAKYDLFEVVRSSNRILRREVDIPAILSEVEDEDAIDPDDLDLATMGGDVSPLQTKDDEYIAGRPVVMEGILEEARTRLEQIGLGIHLEDVLIKQVNYSSAIEATVYAQMNAELEKISAGFRAVGRRRAEQRLGEMERELATIQSEAEQRSERIRGEAEAESIEIYADAYNADPEFFAFVRTLQAYEEILGENSTLIIGTESPLYKLFIEFEKVNPLPPDA